MLIESLMEWCHIVEGDQRECLATLFRLRAANERGWIWKMIDDCPGEVVDVGIVAGRIVVDGIAYPPASMGWAEWVQAVLDVHSIDWNAKPLNLELFRLPIEKTVVKEPHRLTHSPERVEAILFFRLPDPSRGASSK